MLFSISSFANLTLPDFFGSGMVLQQNSKVKIWGSGKTSEPIIITTSWNQKKYTSKVDVYGKWAMEIETPIYGGPYEIK